MIFGRMRRLRHLVQTYYMITLLTMCVFSFIVSPIILCMMDGDCIDISFTSFRGMYPRMISSTCFISFVTLLFKHRLSMSVYETNMESYEAYSPTTAAELRDRTVYWSLLLVICLFVIVPVNVLRLWFLYRNGSETLVMIFFVTMYAENLSMCLVETYFATLCYTLDKKFSKINRDLARLDEEIREGSRLRDIGTAENELPGRVIYDGDFYRPRSACCRVYASIANAVETIRIRHRLIRDAMYAIVDLFGLPIGMFLLNLCVMTLFDIYYEVFSVMGATSRSPMFIYMWLLQNAIRFYMIVVSAHNTTRQVLYMYYNKGILEYNIIYIYICVCVW